MCNSTTPEDNNQQPSPSEPETGSSLIMADGESNDHPNTSDTTNNDVIMALDQQQPCPNSETISSESSPSPSIHYNNLDSSTTNSMSRPPPTSTSSSYGSSVGGAIFNFTNCIVGAGAIGLGGAFADSGGIISIVTIIVFAILTKLSLDLVVELSVEHSHSAAAVATTTTRTTTNNNHHYHHRSVTATKTASYEELGKLAFGEIGRMAVLISKFCYSFGCLVAYIIVVKDNFTPALRHLLFGNNCITSTNWFCHFLQQNNNAQDIITWILGFTVILPLCLLRDMTPLSSLGAVSIASMIMIVIIVFYIYIANPDIRQPGGTIYENWFQIRPGYVERYVLYCKTKAQI